MVEKGKRKLAIALRYRPEQDNAPKVIASGFRERAKRIISMAKDLNIPVYEEPELARTLVGLEIGEEIPPELYQAVAAILVYIQNLDKKAKKI
ncbi:MAG TPA: FhlB domain-containing protein [Clostridia bacterium]|nr:FhlB domain-containing protein [Clostridia bacterium]